MKNQTGKALKQLICVFIYVVLPCVVSAPCFTSGKMTPINVRLFVFNDDIAKASAAGMNGHIAKPIVMGMSFPTLVVHSGERHCVTLERRDR